MKFQDLEMMLDELHLHTEELENLLYHPMEYIEHYHLGNDNRSIISKVVYGDFRLSDDYFRLNGSYNLESLTSDEYKAKIKRFENDIIELHEKYSKEGII